MAAAAARSLGSGEKGLALRASLKGASAQRGRGKRTKNPPKTATKTHTKIKRNLKNKARKHGAKPPAGPADSLGAPVPHTQQQQLWLGTAAAPPRRPLYSSADLASGRAGRAGGREAALQGQHDLADPGPSGPGGIRSCSGESRELPWKHPVQRL